jgi:hypothetical protein
LRCTYICKNESAKWIELQSLHKVLPSTTLIYIVLQDSRQASTSQYYFVLQSVHKACTK